MVRASFSCPFHTRSTSTSQACASAFTTCPVNTYWARSKPAAGELGSHEQACAAPAGHIQQLANMRSTRKFFTGPPDSEATIQFMARRLFDTSHVEHVLDIRKTGRPRSPGAGPSTVSPAQARRQAGTALLPRRSGPRTSTSPGDPYVIAPPTRPFSEEIG